MKNYILFIPVITALLLFSKAIAKGNDKVVLNTDTTKQKVEKIEFITDKYDTIKYTLNQDHLFYTIRKGDVLINHIPPKIMEALRTSNIIMIYLHLNGQIFLVKPSPFFSTDMPDSDYYYPVDNKGAIMFWRTGGINFIKVKPPDKQ